MTDHDAEHGAARVSLGDAGGLFMATRWTWLGMLQGPERERVLDLLCESYWKPLYYFGMAQGLSALDAEDVVQGFFAEFLKKDGFAQVDRSQGRLRAYLMTCFENYRVGVWRRGQAVKRGGRMLRVELREEEEPLDEESPERAYDRHWGLALRERALARVRVEELAKPDGARVWELLGPLLLTEERTRGDGAAAARALGMRKSTARSRLDRLRKRYEDVLFEEAAETMPGLCCEAVYAELRAVGLRA